MKVLFIQHDHVSPTGPVGDRFRQRGFETEEILVVPEAQFGEPNIPFEFPNADDYDVLVPLGAPWGAWDDACIGNWLLPEIEWIRAAAKAGKPILGICFGGQLLARALGGSVAPGPKGEIGWTSIMSDRPGLVSSGPWFQFHYDRWTVPAEAVEIARNPVASQAFTYATCFAVQFHPELVASGLKGWLDWGGDSKVEADGQDPEVLMQMTRAEEPAAIARTYALVDAFIDQISGLDLSE